MTARNPARERLQNGELCLGIGLRQARTVDIAPAMAACGYDWLFIDLEHGTMPLDTAMQILKFWRATIPAALRRGPRC